MSSNNEIEAIIFANAKAGQIQDGNKIKPGDIVTFGGYMDENAFMDEYAWTAIRRFEGVNEWLLARPVSARDLHKNGKYVEAALAMIGIRQYETISVWAEAVVSIHNSTKEFFLQIGANIGQVSSLEDVIAAIDESGMLG